MRGRRFNNIKKRLDYSEYGGAPLTRRATDGVDRARQLERPRDPKCDSQRKEFSESRAGERIERGIAATNAREYAEAVNSQ